MHEYNIHAVNLYISPMLLKIGKKHIVDKFVRAFKLYYPVTTFTNPIYLTGYTPISKKLNPTDILILWNTHDGQDKLAQQFKDANALVLVLENAYLKHESESISLSFDYHNRYKHRITQSTYDKSGLLPPLPKPPKNAHTINRHGIALIASQSKSFDGPGLGNNSQTQPAGWDKKIMTLCASRFERVIFKPHPKAGNIQQYQDFASGFNGKVIVDQNYSEWNQDVTVVFSSNYATDSIVHGIPVIYKGSTIFAAEISYPGIHEFQHHSTDLTEFYSRRLTMLEEQYQSQTTVKDINEKLISKILFNFEVYENFEVYGSTVPNRSSTELN